MDPLNKSTCSVDTEYLLKLPPNAFDPDLNQSLEKGHFSNEQSFMREIDNFLIASNREQKGTLNTSGNDIPTYNQFATTLHNSPTEPDLNLQVIMIFQKKIQQLQNKILTLSREKEEIIKKLKCNEGLDVENERLRNKIIRMEHETANIISIIKRYETKNEMLEVKIENLTTTAQESNNLSKNQIQELQIRLKNYAKVEQELRKEIEKSSEIINDFSKKEQKQIKEFNEQRETLKSYYQSQLETALEEKVKEYQQQLDKYQAEIEERSISQIELIIGKNEEELELMGRKCKEEVELYRVQLLNANRQIKSLELKLNEYQKRRLNITEDLHMIMESQWKKILDVISCPLTSESEDKINYSSQSELLQSYIDKMRNQF